MILNAIKKARARVCVCVLCVLRGVLVLFVVFLFVHFLFRALLSSAVCGGNNSCSRVVSGTSFLTAFIHFFYFFCCVF